MRALVIIALSGVAGTCSSPPLLHGPESLLEEIKQSGEFRVVTRNSPVTFYHGADQSRGIDYELAQGFANRLGVDLKIYVAEPFREILRSASSLDGVPTENQFSTHVSAA